MSIHDDDDRATSHEEPDDLHFLVHHAALPETGFSRAIDGAIKRFGSGISWFWIALMAVICVNVFMKNVLGQGSVQFEEIQWHIYAALFLLGKSNLDITQICFEVGYQSVSQFNRAFRTIKGMSPSAYRDSPSS